MWNTQIHVSTTSSTRKHQRMREKEEGKDTWKYLGPWNQPDFKFVPKTYQTKSKQQFSQLEWRGFLIAPCLCICCRKLRGSITGVQQAARFRWISELAVIKCLQKSRYKIRAEILLRDIFSALTRTDVHSLHLPLWTGGWLLSSCSAFPECRACTGTSALW